MQLVRYEAARATLDVTSDGSNLLVTSEVDWPAWHIEWNGRPLPRVVVHGAFAGWFVPPGRGTVAIRYAW